MYFDVRDLCNKPEQPTARFNLPADLPRGLSHWTMEGEKHTIRQQLREQRRGLSAAVVRAANAAVCAHVRAFRPFQEARSIIAYIAAENEISVAAVFDEVVRSGRTLYLPETTRGGSFAPWRPGEPLARGRGGVLEPLSAAAETPERPAVALVPVVGWDRNGTRLGRGGGFYDRVFSKLAQGITRVGLAHDFQEFPRIQPQPWDVPLHYVITARGVVQCGAGAARNEWLQRGGGQLS
ncbi:MAG: 5-formyltetrahydrofolate cyclo-ligase [Candidatus Binatia bacterium]